MIGWCYRFLVKQICCHMSHQNYFTFSIKQFFLLFTTTISWDIQTNFHVVPYALDRLGRVNSGVFPVALSAHIFSKCVPSPWFSIIEPLFLDFQFKGISIWDWDMNFCCKELEFRHHAPLVFFSSRNSLYVWEKRSEKMPNLWDFLNKGQRMQSHVPLILVYESN